MMNRFVSILVLVIALCFVAGCNRDPNAAKQKYVESGNKYFEKAKYKEALIMYRKALQRDMKYGEAYYRAGLTELKLQRYAEAAGSLRRAVELQPQKLDAYNQLANLYLTFYTIDRSRPKQLLGELKSLSQQFTKRFAGGYDDERLKGYIALFDGNSPDALQHFEKANQVKPYQPDLVLVLMQTLAVNKRADEAEKLGYDMIAKNPSALGVYDALYLQYVRTGKLAEGEKILKTKVEKNPKVADAYLQLAAYYYAAKQRDKMLSTLNQVSSNSSVFPDGPLYVGGFLQNRANEWDLALQQYQQGLQRSPKDKHAYQRRIVEVLAKQGKRDEASRLLAQILSEDPKDAEALGMRASMSLAAGTREQLESAIKDLQAVKAQQPTNAVVRYSLGRALLAKGSPDQARAELEEAVKLRTDYLLPRIVLAEMTLQRRDFGRVVQMAQEILTMDPSNVPARLLRSRALAALGDVKQARQEVQSILKTVPDLPDARLQLASIDLREGNYKGAESGFRNLYERSKDSRAFMGLVETYVAQKQPGTALQILRNEIAKSPDRTDFRVALASISTMTSDYATAVAEYNKVLEKNPNNAQVWLQLADTQRRAGQMDQAISSLKKAGEVAPNDPRSFLQLALLYETLGRSSEAKPLYERVLRIQPDQAIALNNLAYILADSGSNLDQALTMAQKATQQMPNDGNVGDTLGLIYIKKNLPDSAIGVYRKLIEREPDRALFRYHLALALQQKGDKTQARKECETALQSKTGKDEEAKIRELLAKLG